MVNPQILRSGMRGLSQRHAFHFQVTGSPVHVNKITTATIMAASVLNNNNQNNKQTKKETNKQETTT